MAQIRLTKTMREDILRKIMNDLPQVNYIEQLHDVIRKEVKSKIPPEILKMIGTPLEVHLSSFSRSYYFRGVGRSFSVCVTGANRDDLPLSQDTIDEVNGLYTLHRKQQDAYNALSDQVETTLAAYTTVAKLREACPQFDKYLPNEAAINHPITVTTSPVPALQAAGWPKGKP